MRKNKIYLIPSDFFVLWFIPEYQKIFKTFCNGCKPSWLPKWLKFNKNEKRKKACNFHDFLYKIGHPRKESDILFLEEMKKHCHSTKIDKSINYSFYWLVRMFGKKSWSNKRLTAQEFLLLGKKSEKK